MGEIEGTYGVERSALVLPDIPVALEEVLLAFLAEGVVHAHDNLFVGSALEGNLNERKWRNL